ncbi:MAG: TRAP transporter substrate-binding protein DctP [Candidatus Eisenbacteria bacterium]|uniref:TRAP transporter substrate-binding protein DctP n=1 Tax=Eiseniibacteriota bacterium TaxID=2212470 RepID=A0A956RPZ7_UNCEI|nr:TRAP transporter substrate-binding protein DctP [Candidatus Eisenbacteria bacterium]
MSFSDRERLLFVLGAGLLLCLTFAAPGFAAKAKYEIKIATLAPEGSTWMNVMHELDDEIRAETAGDVGLRFYAGGIQGDEPVVLRKIRTGQLHGGGLTGVGLGEIASGVRVMELPFLFENEAEVAAAHERMDPIFDQMLKEAGFTILGWADVGFVYLYSQTPIRSQEDLKEQKVWLWEGDPLAEAFLKAANVSPVPLPITDVMTSLQTGLISSVYVSPLACIALQWFTRVKYTTDLPITHAMGAVVISNAAWDKVPEQHRPKVRALCDQYFDKLRSATRDESARSAEVIAESNVQTVTADPAEVARFRALGQSVAEELKGSLYSADLLAQIQSAVAEARAGGSSRNEQP